MAYINVVEWSPDQVTDWIKGMSPNYSVMHDSHKRPNPFWSNTTHPTTDDIAVITT